MTEGAADQGAAVLGLELIQQLSDDSGYVWGEAAGAYRRSGGPPARLLEGEAQMQRHPVAGEGVQHLGPLVSLEVTPGFGQPPPQEGVTLLGRHRRQGQRPGTQTADDDIRGAAELRRQHDAYARWQLRGQPTRLGCGVVELVERVEDEDETRLGWPPGQLLAECVDLSRRARRWWRIGAAAQSQQLSPEVLRERTNVGRSWSCPV
jgi:hypothetical protein